MYKKQTVVLPSYKFIAITKAPLKEETTPRGDSLLLPSQYFISANSILFKPC